MIDAVIRASTGTWLVLGRLNFYPSMEIQKLTDLNEAVLEKGSRSRDINTICSCGEGLSCCGGRYLLSVEVLMVIELLVTKPQVGRARLHVHIRGYKGRSGADMRQ